MTRIAISIALVTLAIPVAGAMAQALMPSPVLESRTTTPAKDGSPQPVLVRVQSWGMAGQGHAAQEIPLRGFYLAHLLSGHISATMDGQTTERLPDDYWDVKPGAAMQVKVLGEYAVLETTVVAKQ
jgi:hypothetical protein